MAAARAQTLAGHGGWAAVKAGLAQTKRKGRESCRGTGEGAVVGRDLVRVSFAG